MLRTKRDNELEVNITPLIDVVFLLLIFFMVSTTFQRESEITIELPESSGDIAETEKKVIEISIDNQGRYFVNQRRVKDTDIKTLKKAISTAIKSDSNAQQNACKEMIARDALRGISMKKCMN